MESIKGLVFSLFFCILDIGNTETTGVGGWLPSAFADYKRCLSRQQINPLKINDNNEGL